MVNPFEPLPVLGTLRADRSEYAYDPALGQQRDVLAEPEEPRSLRGLLIVSCVLAVLLGLRLIHLQIVQGTNNRVLAEGNRIREREIRAPRGEIYDRNGTLLAGNVATYTLELFPAELPRKRQDREAVLQAVQVATGVDLGPIREALRSQGLASLEPIAVVDQLDHDTALKWQIHLADLPGVSVTKLPERQYATSAGLGHILGYVGQVSAADQEQWPNLSLAAQVGKTGLEYQYESQLQGTPGQERIEVDAKGRVERVLSQVSPKLGDALTLSLDATLQDSLVKNLEKAGEKKGSTKAAAVVLDVHTGEIVALASLPTFDPNAFVEVNRQAERTSLLKDPNDPLLNRVTKGGYPSGSAIKPVLATAGLTEGTITPKTQLDTSSGVIQIGQWRFPDWKVHGLTDVRRAIAESNDIFFYAVGGGFDQIQGLGVARLKTWLTKFGFGGLTGIDLPGEAKGNVPDEAWKKAHYKEPWYIGDTYHLAIGQGFFVATPLQLAVATAAIANGGSLIIPHLLLSRKPADGSPIQSQAPAMRATNLAPSDALQVVREGMRLTVTDGTARSLNQLGVPIAGKTGTAQFGADKQTHSWFVGYAPADNPEIAMAFIVEGGGESSDTAVPAAKGFLEDWIAHRASPPSPSPAPTP